MLAVISAQAIADAPAAWLARTGKETPAELAAAYPDSAAALRRLIGAEVAAGPPTAVGTSLARLAAMGFALSEPGQKQLGPLIAPAVAEQFTRNARSLGATRAVGQVPAEFGLVEDVVQTGGWWVASSITGQDLVVSRDGQTWRWLGLKGIASPAGLALADQRGCVWAAVGVFDQTARSDGAFVGLVLVDLSRGEVIRRIAAPPGVLAGDLVAGSDGTLFVSDPLGGGLWRARSGDTTLERLVPAGTFRSPQGLALSPDGRLLYVSDYGSGLAVVDLRRSNVARLEIARPAMLDGIDGLVAHEGRLVAIQNGTRPMRILQLNLAQSGRAVTRIDVLLARMPGDGEPTNGSIRAGSLTYVGNARWDRFGKGGSLVGEGPPPVTSIHTIRLSPTR